MNIPFADLFKKAKTRFSSAKKTAGPAPLPVAVNKSDDYKFAKTVMPNAVLTVTAEISHTPTAPKMVSLGHRPKQSDLPPAVALALEPRVERALSLALGDVMAKVPEGYLKPPVSFDTTRRVLLKAAEVEKGMATGQPSIGVNSLYKQMPEIFMRAVPASDAARILLPIAKVMEEMLQLVTRNDQTTEPVTEQFETPFLQVTLEESKKFGTTMAPVTLEEMPSVPRGMMPASARSLAAAEPEPTLQERYTMTPLAATLAPPPSVVEKPAVRPSLPVSGAKPASLVDSQPLSTGESAPTRIPFTLETKPKEENRATTESPKNLSDVGTGEPAIPRVPASCGPPVPQSLHPVEAPTRIPFKLSVASTESAAPDEQNKPATDRSAEAPSKPDASLGRGAKISLSLLGEAVGGGEKAAKEGLGGLSLDAPAPSAASSTHSPAGEATVPMVRLPLRAILQTLPPLQWQGNAEAVPSETKIAFPFSNIAPQLASGRVVISPRDFQSALPPEYRDQFLPEAVDAPVPLSLPDVLMNLPGNALEMRLDQEEEQQEEVFETPFSKKAEEDAARFQQSREAGEAAKGGDAAAENGPVALTQNASVAQKESGDRIDIAGISIPREVGEVTELFRAGKADQRNGEHIETAKFDAKAAVAKACQLSGVAFCNVTFTDGLAIAGNVPDELQIDGLSAVAPTMLQKLGKHMLETQLGALTCLTVHGEKTPVTFFTAGNICLTAVHTAAELPAASRTELASITQELSRTYAQPETTHVDH